MEIEKLHQGMLVATEERMAGGRRTLVYGPVSMIDKENDTIAISIDRNGGGREQRSFPASRVIPIHTLFNRKNRKIAQLISNKRTLEGFIVALARGNVRESSIQEVLETMAPDQTYSE